VWSCLKILSVTCDNASPNDTMIDELAALIDNFPGSGNGTHCFAHVLNLVARSIVQVFDVPKANVKEAEEELSKLANELELDSNELADEQPEGSTGLDEDGDDDNVEGWVDEQKEMSAAERLSLVKAVRPVRLILVKVCVFGQLESCLNIPDEQTGVCNQKLNNNYLTPVV
jgi:hypothetical protein